jgi:hypothetical protein
MPAWARDHVRVKVEPKISGLSRKHKPALIPLRDIVVMPIVCRSHFNARATTALRIKEIT